MTDGFCDPATQREKDLVSQTKKLLLRNKPRNSVTELQLLVRSVHFNPSCDALKKEGLTELAEVGRHLCL